MACYDPIVRQSRTGPTMSKVAYFNVVNGLRGCLVPDSAFVARVTTRRDLHAIIAGECAILREAYRFGGSQKELSRVTQALWRETRKGARKATLPHAIGFGDKAGQLTYGLHVGHATREDWEEYQSQDD